MQNNSFGFLNKSHASKYILSYALPPPVNFYNLTTNIC